MFLKLTNSEPLRAWIIFLPVILVCSPQRIEGLQKCGDVMITIERESCFGGCPVYAARIHTDGSVVYVGVRFVKEIGERRFKISQQRIRELIQAFEEINYFSLKNTYGMSGTDLPTTTTSICLKGKRKKVVNYYFAPPKELERLEDKIEELADLRGFIGHSW